MNDFLALCLTADLLAGGGHGAGQSVWRRLLALLFSSGGLLGVLVAAYGCMALRHRAKEGPVAMIIISCVFS